MSWEQFNERYFYVSGAKVGYPKTFLEALSRFDRWNRLKVEA